MLKGISDYDAHADIRDGVRALCAEFGSAYFQKVDQAHAYPDEFVTALTKAGWLSALIPEQYGGSGLPLTAATVIMEEINRSGGNAGFCSADGKRTWQADRRPGQTVPTAQWNGVWLVVSGEQRPGVRSPEVWRLQP